jgi:sulfate transport system substrate-binding protein
MLSKPLLPALVVLGILGWLVYVVIAGGVVTQNDLELLNVSYDPTRELWRDLNARFVEHYEQDTGIRLAIRQSHGGSSSQARAVLDGLEADVVSLALWEDTDALRRKGLIDPGWEGRFPHRSLPYFSTIVFVVRRGNPHGIHDWPDLLKPGVRVITPNPKTSGNGKLSFLAAWGAALSRGGSEGEARDFVTQVYRRVPVLDTGARGSTVTFAQRKIGEVHLTWENEGHLEVLAAKGELELVYPPVSLKAEPHVAVVDANARRRGTARAAEAYLKFLYTDEGQEIIARHFYRPINPEVLRRHADTFRDLTLFPVTRVARDWEDAQRRFFAEGAAFDQIYQDRAR